VITFRRQIRGLVRVLADPVAREMLAQRGWRHHLSLRPAAVGVFYGRPRAQCKAKTVRKQDLANQMSNIEMWMLP